jgi:hypothetical protein
MRTNWSLTVFLVCGLISASSILYTAIKVNDNHNTDTRPLSALIAAIAGAACVTIIALKVNSPANLINILGKPTAGLSSSVMSQMAVFLIGAVVYLKKLRGKAVSIMLAFLFLISLFCLNRLYMISTRCALNTLLLMLAYMSASYFCASAFMQEDKPVISLVLSIIASAILTAFFVRIALISPPDRVLSIDMLLFGILAPVFWAYVLTGVIIPLAASIKRLFSDKGLPTILLAVSAIVALMLLSIIINQMPAHLDAVQGRMLF